MKGALFLVGDLANHILRWQITFVIISYILKVLILYAMLILLVVSNSLLLIDVRASMGILLLK